MLLADNAPLDAALLACVRAHRLRRLQRPATRKDRQAAQQHTFFIGQQTVTPIEERAQRLLTRQCSPTTAGQQTKSIIQPIRDLFGRQDRDARRRKFERERFELLEAGLDARILIKVQAGDAAGQHGHAAAGTTAP